MLPDPLTTTWTSGGLAKGVTTPRESGEGDGPYVTRHEALVRVLQAAYPVDAGSEQKNY